MMKKQRPQKVKTPECPVCWVAMTAPIYQCKTGHSVCATCTTKLDPPLCPLCRQEMTQMRNWQLEALVAEAEVPCPNKSLGCTFMLEKAELDKHLAECIYRNINCPMMVLGKCSWNGLLMTISAHFRDRHPNNIIQQNIPTHINMNFEENNHFIYLLTDQNKFIVNMKINIMDKMVYWSIQHTGTQHSSRHFFYEIIIGPNDTHNVTFTDNCINSNTKVDEIFSTARCPILSFNVLKHYLRNNKLTFKVLIKKNNLHQNKVSGQPNAHSKPGNSNKSIPMPKSLLSLTSFQI